MVCMKRIPSLPSPPSPHALPLIPHPPPPRFAVLVSMSSALNDTGLITAFADIVGKALTSLNMGWEPVFFILHGAFFFLHYLFAGQTAHVGALFTAFLAMMLASGVFWGRSVICDL
jgi:hypothetical protein